MDKIVLLKDIKDIYRIAIKNKAILSFKYDNLNRKISFIQISVIFVSTIITFIETLKSQYEYESVGWDIVPIVLASYIGLIMAILRFYKWEEVKENVSKSHDNHVFITNKLIKINNTIEKFNFETGPQHEWDTIVATFKNEIFDNFVTIKETFDSIVRYKDMIYYKNKFRKLYLKNEIMNNDIESVNRNKKKPLTRFRRFNCCPFKKSIRYDKFFKEMEGMHSDDEEEEYNNVIPRSAIRRNNFRDSSFGATMSPQTRAPEVNIPPEETTFVSSV